MDYLFQDIGKPKKVGRPKGSKNDKKTKTSSETKTSKKPKKGGNFLGSIGELVAPTGWESFASTAALLAIDRADAALRRFKKKMSGGHWGTRKQIFNKDMKKLKIEYDESDGKWKRNGVVVIDSSKNTSNFPQLAIVIDSLSKFFNIPLKHKNGKPFNRIRRTERDLFNTSPEKRKEIYDQMFIDIYEKLESEHKL